MYLSCMDALPKKKPWVSDKNVKKRLQFAKEHIHKGSNFCHMILWRDESKFNVFGSDGKHYVRRPPNNQLNLKYTKKIIKYGGASIMIWCCFNSSGARPLLKIKGSMNGQVYKDIPKNNLSG